MHTVTISVHNGHRLDHENIYRRTYNGLQRTLWEQLDDPDFANDLALPSHNQKQMQKNITNRKNCSHVRTKCEQSNVRTKCEQSNVRTKCEQSNEAP